MKHPIWMAFEHRRQLDGHATSEANGCVPVTMIEATAARDGDAASAGEKRQSESDG